MKNWEKQLPDASIELSEEHLYEFFRTMYERNQISVKRILHKKPAPWSTDPILSNYKYCNVYRELDRCSQYLINNVIRVEKDWNEMLWKIMFYRIFNAPEHIEALGGFPSYYTYKPEKVIQKIKDLYEGKGIKVLNNKAYSICSYIAPGYGAENYARLMLPVMHENVPKLRAIMEEGKSVDKFLKQLQIVRGVGGFLSHEWFVDYCYVNIYKYGMKFPWTQDDYTNVGPGAFIGLRLIFPSLKKGKDGIYVLRDIAGDYLKQFGDFHYIEWNKSLNQYVIAKKPNITLHQIEFWLCEYAKYWKMTIKEGRQRETFKRKTVY